MCVAIGGLARYGNGNSIIDIGVEQQHLFYAIHGSGDEFVVWEVLLKSLKKQGSEASSHKFTH